MIYANNKAWYQLTRGYNILDQPKQILMDLSLVQRDLMPDIQAISTKCQMPSQIVLKQFEEIMTAFQTARNRLNTIILPLRSFFETRTEGYPQQKFNTGKSQFENLQDCGFNRGVNVPVSQLESFPPSCITASMLQAMIVIACNVNLAVPEDLAKWAEFVVRFHNNHGNKLYLINLQLENHRQLQRFHGQVLKSGVPMEYVLVNCDLMNSFTLEDILSGQQLQDALQYEEGHKLHHYERYIKKYLGSSYANIYYTFGTRSDMSKMDDNDILKSLDQAYLQYMSYLKKLEVQTPIYAGGVVLGSIQFLLALRQFAGNQRLYAHTHAQMDRVALNPLKKVFDSEYKTNMLL